MMPEREREALMRLTMCAREECGMCKYKERCDFDFQFELATKNMNILADALRAEQTEPQFDKDINVRSKDEPQYDAEEVAKDINRRIAMGQRLETMSCQECKYWKYIAKEWQCSVEKCQYEPQTDCSWK